MNGYLEINEKLNMAVEEIKMQARKLEKSEQGLPINVSAHMHNVRQAVENLRLAMQQHVPDYKLPGRY